MPTLACNATHFQISVLYATGNVILAIAAIFEKGHPVHPFHHPLHWHTIATRRRWDESWGRWVDILGLLVIGLGTGGIKPCVSAFGGDQFKKGQERMLEAFFSIFYFSINAGSLITTFISMPNTLSSRAKMGGRP